MAQGVWSMCRIWLFPLTELCLPGSSDTGLQNGCHHPLEQKSFTGESLVMHKHMYYTQTFSSHAPVHAGPDVHEDLDGPNWWHCLRQHVMWKWKYRFGHQYFNSSVNCLQDYALLRASCLQFEACQGWFLLTGGIVSVDKTMTNPVDCFSSLLEDGSGS